MPYREWLEDFAPEELVAVAAAFEGACKELGLTTDRSDVIILVAKAVIDAARAGVVDAVDLQEQAIRTIRGHSAVAPA